MVQDDWLAARGWQLDAQASELLPATQHATRLVRDASGRRLLLKPTPREGEVLRALTSLGPGPLGTPAVAAAPPEIAEVALLWIEGATNLAQYQIARRDWSTDRAAALGRGLGWLHAHTREPTPGLAAPRGTDELQALVLLEPDFYARLTPAGRAFYEVLQATPDAFDALYDLLAAPPVTSWLHGDCKLANWVRVPGEPERLVLLDWEAAGRGDPVRDLAELGASYAAERWLATARAPLDESTLGGCLAALLEGYLAEYGEPDPGFLERLVRWTGVSLLWQALSMAQDLRLRHVTHETLEPAFVLVVHPAAGRTQLWGR